MKRTIAAAICLCGMMAGCSLTARAQPSGTGTTKLIPAWFWGCWVVKRELPVPTAVVGISAGKAKSIIGTRLVFAPSWARSGRIVVRPASYSLTVLSSWQFLKKHHGSASVITLRQIGVRSGYVTEVQVAPPEGLSDLDFVASDLYLRKRQKDIVIDVEGDTFVAEKAKPGDPACTCASPGGNQKKGKQR